jgi:hypothetical protein
VRKVHVAFLNFYKELTSAEIKAVVKALQIQVSRDFAPAWGIDAELKYYSDPQKVPDHAWQMVILESSDQSGDLGYHELTTSGKPLGRIFAGTIRRNQDSWTNTASHELLEMLGDPEASTYIFRQGRDGSGILYAYENCDATQDSRYGYKINGVLVSNFVYPSWFEPYHPPGTRFDHLKLIRKAFQLLPGGYIPTYTIAKKKKWKMMNGPKISAGKADNSSPGGRIHRRKQGRHTWKKSKYVREKK